MSKIIVFIKSNPIFISLFIGVVSISTAVTAVLLPGAQGEPGKEVEFRVTDEAIEYRYDGDSTYTTLIDLDDLIGPMGMNGKDVFFDINETHILWRYSDQTTWMNLIDLESLRGMPGNNGKAIEIDITSTHIVWRYEQDETWRNLIDLDLLKGQDGREVEFQTSDTHIQWRYVGASTWMDLLSLSIIKGTSGQEGREVEFQTSLTHIQWRYVEDLIWNDLLAISLLKGANGQDGREVEFLTSDTHIQWRYVGDDTFSNLFLLELLKGDPGDNGLPGLDGKEVEFQTNDTILQWRYIGESLWMNVYDFENLIAIDGVSLETISINETLISSYVIFDSMRYAKETVVDGALGVFAHEFKVIPDTYNPNAEIYYSGYGTNNANNNPQTGNSFGYEVFVILGTLSTDLHFGVSYFFDEVPGEVIEIRVTYDLNLELWAEAIVENESYLSNIYDERYLIVIGMFDPYQNQNIIIPAGSSNVLVEMYVSSNQTKDYDLAYYILGDRIDTSLENDETFYGFTLTPDIYNIDLEINLEVENNVVQDNSIDYYFIIATTDDILYVGGTDISGTLESLGIGVGTYRFFSIGDDMTRDRLIINGTLEAILHVYFVVNEQVEFNLTVEEFNSGEFYTWIRYNHINSIQKVSRSLAFELSDTTVFEFNLDDIIGYNINESLTSFYEEVMLELESRLPFIVIETADDFQAMNQCLSCNYILKNDIDLDDLEQFTPIGTENRPFTGSLDGNGFVIENVPSQSGDTENPYALFAYAINARFKNLTIFNLSYVATSSSGLIVGMSFGDEENQMQYLSFENIRIYISDLTLENKSGLLVGDALYIQIILNDITMTILESTIDDFSGIFIGQIEEVILDARHVQLTVDDSDFFTNSSGFIGYTLLSRVSMYHSEFFLPTIESDGRDIAVMFAWVVDSEVTLKNTYLDFYLSGTLSIDPLENVSVGGVFGTLTQSTAFIDGLSLGINNIVAINQIQSHAGAIVGHLDSSTLLVNHVNGISVVSHGVERLGGLIGFADGSESSESIIRLSNIDLIVNIDTSAKEVGGLIGAVKNTLVTVFLVELTGDVELYSDTSSYFGGIIGRVYYVSSTKASIIFINHVNVTLNISKFDIEDIIDGFIGGFIGLVEGPLYEESTQEYSFNGVVTTIFTRVLIRNASSNSLIYSEANYYGGFIGYISGGELELINIVSSGKVYSPNNDYGGGFIGYVHHSYVFIELGKATGIVFGNDYLGGFIGYVEGPSFVNIFPSVSQLIEIYSFSNRMNLFDVYGGKDNDAVVVLSSVRQLTEGTPNNS